MDVYSSKAAKLVKRSRSTIAFMVGLGRYGNGWWGKATNITGGNYLAALMAHERANFITSHKILPRYPNLSICPRSEACSRTDASKWIFRTLVARGHGSEAWLFGDIWRLCLMLKVWFLAMKNTANLTVCYGIDGPFSSMNYLWTMMSFQNYVKLPGDKRWNLFVLIETVFCCWS